MLMNIFYVWAVRVLLVVVLILTISTCSYRHVYHSTGDELKLLKYDVEKQNKEVAVKLKTLTAERDAKQATLNKQFKEREKIDAIAQNGIDRLNSELRSSTVRVRIKPSSGCGGGISTSDQATNAANRAADETETSGVLPETNTRRLADALTEIETLSAAYNSCRAIELPS